jgi:hypothetical protein
MGKRIVDFDIYGFGFYTVCAISVGVVFGLFIAGAFR